MNIGISGDMGSFSEEAAWLYAKQNNLSPTLDYLIDMEGVLAKLSSHELDLGIFPVVNSLGGLVTQAFIAMGKYSFTFVDKLCLEIHQCLLVLPNTSKDDIQTIVSHPQGLAQCQRYLDKHYPGVKQQAWMDTAKAARDLASDVLSKDTAVIAPARSAEVFGLEVIARDIQDKSPNITTFIMVKPYEGA